MQSYIQFWQWDRPVGFSIFHVSTCGRKNGFRVALQACLLCFYLFPETKQIAVLLQKCNIYIF